MCSGTSTGRDPSGCGAVESAAAYARRAVLRASNTKPIDASSAAPHHSNVNAAPSWNGSDTCRPSAVTVDGALAESLPESD